MFQQLSGRLRASLRRERRGAREGGHGWGSGGVQEGGGVQRGSNGGQKGEERAPPRPRQGGRRKGMGSMVGGPSGHLRGLCLFCAGWNHRRPNGRIRNHVVGHKFVEKKVASSARWKLTRRFSTGPLGQGEFQSRIAYVSSVLFLSFSLWILREHA